MTCQPVGRPCILGLIESPNTARNKPESCASCCANEGLFDRRDATEFVAGVGEGQARTGAPHGAVTGGLGKTVVRPGFRKGADADALQQAVSGVTGEGHGATTEVQLREQAVGVVLVGGGLVGGAATGGAGVDGGEAQVGVIGEVDVAVAADRHLVASFSLMGKLNHYAQI